MSVLSVAVGLAVLAFGRKLFWLSVGAAGFAAGMFFGFEWLSNQESWVIWLVAAVCGIIGAMCSIFLQKIAIGLAGFVIGGYISFSLIERAYSILEPWPLIGFFIGGLLGLLFVTIFFEWSLIVLSSLVGAVLVVQTAALDPPAAVLLFVVLLVGGIGVQFKLFQAQRLRQKPQ